MSDSHDAHGHGHGEAVYPYTPHHFHTAKQHLESGKMGVWLFLVTEILFFAGLFCAYTIYRAQHPEVFYWAHFYLDTTWGAVNTVVLIFSSFTAAWAVRNAQLGQKKLLQINIIITMICACIFMVVKYVEYSHKFHDGLLPARHFEPAHEVWETPDFKKKHPESAAAAERIVAGLAARKNVQAAVSDEIVGAREGLALVPVANEGDAKVDATLAPTSEGPVTGKAPAPPAMGEKAAVTEETAADSTSAAEDVMPTTLAQEAQAADKEEESDGAVAEKSAPKAKPQEILSDEAWLQRQISAMSPAERRPLQMAGVIRSPADGPLEFARPAKAGVFFSIYFFMTGLHGFHVLVGIGLWVWMLFIAKRRQMGAKYFGPIEFTALYWHLVDLIWIYLFPMLYLIH
jgi:cytochrome c oxidase subunit III